MTLSKFIYSRWAVVIVALLCLAMRGQHIAQEFTGYHSWRQTQTQTTVLNFAYEDGNILNPQVNTFHNGSTVQRMEFPLMQWLFSWPYRLLGDHPAISRVLTFLMSIVSLLAFYQLVMQLAQSKLLAAVASYCLAFSPLFYYYSINPLPDNMALMFALLGLAAISNNRVSWQRFAVAALWLSLAAACKLPFIVFGAALIPTWLSWCISAPKKAIASAIIGLVLFLPTLLWYAWVIPTWEGNMVLNGGWDNPRNSFDILKSVWTMMLPEMLLNYASVPFFVLGIWQFIKRKMWTRSALWPVLLTTPLVVAYYLFEMHAIGKGHDYYMMPFVPILFLTVALGAHFVLRLNPQFRKWILLPILVLPITCFLKADVRWANGAKQGQWVHAEALRKAIPEGSLCVAGNDVSQRIHLYALRRKGWAFMDDSLPVEYLEQYVNQGAEYLVSTSSAVEEDAALQPYLGELVFDSEEIRAYRLHPKN